MTKETAKVFDQASSRTIQRAVSRWKSFYKNLGAIVRNVQALEGYWKESIPSFTRNIISSSSLQREWNIELAIFFHKRRGKTTRIGLNGGTKCFHSWRGTGRDGSRVLSLGRADGSSRIIIVKSVRMQGICGEFRWNQSPASRIWVATYFFNARLFQDIEDTRRGLIVSWTVSRGFFRRNGTFETRVTEFHRSKFTLSIILLKKWEKAKKRNRWMMKIYKTKTVTRSLFEGESLKIRWSTLLFIIRNIPTNYRTNPYLRSVEYFARKKSVIAQENIFEEENR